jgi:DnaJ-class molecular chaperone
MKNTDVATCPTDVCPYCMGEGTQKDEAGIRMHRRCPDCKGSGKRCQISLLPISECPKDHAMYRPIPQKYHK